MAALPFTNTKKELYFPSFGRLYDKAAQPLSWLILRLTIGLSLIGTSWMQIQNPLALTRFFDSAGLTPGYIWSPTITGLQLLTGVLITLGLFTRPAAFVAFLMFLASLWYYAMLPMGSGLLTASGIEALRDSPEFFAQGNARLLSDGGRELLQMLQQKSICSALYASVICLLFACFGGGYLSVDRAWMKKRV